MVAGTERIRRPVAWKTALAIAAARAGDPDFAGAFGAGWPEVGAGQTSPVAGPGEPLKPTPMVWGPITPRA
jgi:hypothetical protein